MAGGRDDAEGLERTRATFAVLTRAVCPPADLTAEVVDATVDEVLALVAVLAPATRWALRGAVAALEHGGRAGGRPRLSLLDDTAAREMLERWSHGPLRLAIRLL